MTAESKQKPRLEISSLYAWSALISAAPLACLLTDLFMFRDEASSWLTMRIMAAQMLIDGKVLYQDFFEWTQPIVFEIAKLLLSPLSLTQLIVPRQVATTFMPPDLLVTSIIFLFLLASGAITVFLGKHCIDTTDSAVAQEIKQTLLAYLTGFAIANLLIRFEFGDLQHLLAIALCPWIFMRWLQCKGLSIPRKLSVSISLLTGLVVCFDIPFLPVILVLELFWLINEKTSTSILIPSLATLLMVPLLYITILLVLPMPFWSDYWLKAMPLRWLSYFSEYHAIFSPVSTPRRTDVLYCMGIAIILSQLADRKSSLAAAMSMLAFLGFSIFFLENNGLSRDLILTIFGTTTSLTLLITNWLNRLTRALSGSDVHALSLCWKQLQDYSGRKNNLPVLETTLLAVAIIASLYGAIGMANSRIAIADLRGSEFLKNPETLEQAIMRRTSPLDKVSIIVDGPEPAYPTLVLTDRRPDIFFMYARPLLVLDFFGSKHLTRDLKDLKKHAYSCLSDALSNRSATAIVVSDDYPQVLLRQAGIWNMLDRNYEEKTICVFSSANSQPFEYVGFNWPMPFFERRTKP